MPDDTQVPAEEQQESTTPNQDFRQSQLAQQTFAELKAAREELAAIKKAAEDKEAEEARKKLEAEGNYKAALEQQQSELKQLKAQHAKDILQRDLKTALIKAGASNDIFLSGAVSSFTGDMDGIAEYVDTLKGDESNASFFGTAEQSNPGIKPAPSGAPAANGDSLSEEELLANGDPETMKKVFFRELGIPQP